MTETPGPPPRAPRTYMPAFQHRDLSQANLQRNWSMWRAERQRQTSRQVWPQDAKPVTFSDRITIICGHCHEPAGHIVTFHADDLHGILDDIASTTRRPLSITPKPDRKPYWLHVSGDGRTALATFHCRRCGRTHPPRNAHKLAVAIAQVGETRYTISG